MLLKTNSEETEEWLSIYPIGYGTVHGEFLYQSNDNEYIIGAYTEKTSSQWDSFVAKIRISPTGN